MAPIRISAAVFADYLAGVGRDRMSIVTAQRQRYEDPNRLAWFFYRPMISAIRRCLAEPDPHPVLLEAVEQANDAQRPHFWALFEGFLGWLPHPAPTLVPVGSTVWTSGDLEVVLRPELGIVDRSGQTWAVLLYLKEPELPRPTAQAVLRLMERHMDELLPGGRPAMLDVRRSRMHRLRSNAPRARLDAWLNGEAIGYAAHWNAA